MTLTCGVAIKRGQKALRSYYPLLLIGTASNALYFMSYSVIPIMKNEFLEALQTTNSVFGQALACRGIASLLTYYIGGFVADTVKEKQYNYLLGFCILFNTMPYLLIPLFWPGEWGLYALYGLVFGLQTMSWSAENKATMMFAGDPTVLGFALAITNLFKQFMLTVSLQVVLQAKAWADTRWNKTDLGGGSADNEIMFNNETMWNDDDDDDNNNNTGDFVYFAGSAASLAKSRYVVTVVFVASVTVALISSIVTILFLKTKTASKSTAHGYRRLSRTNSQISVDYGYDNFETVPEEGKSESVRVVAEDPDTGYGIADSAYGAICRSNSRMSINSNRNNNNNNLSNDTNHFEEIQSSESEGNSPRVLNRVNSASLIEFMDDIGKVRIDSLPSIRAASIVNSNLIDLSSIQEPTLDNNISR